MSSIGSSGGDDLRLIPGVWRPRSLELLTRCWLALGRPSEAERAAARTEATAAALRLRMADSMADRAAAAVALDAGDPDAAAERALASAAAADEVGAPVEAALSRTLAGRALAQAGQPERATWPSCGAPPGSCTPAARSDIAPRPSGSCETSAIATYRRTRPGQGDGVGVASLTGARAGSRAARRRPQDEPADRRSALPQSEDGRDAHTKHLPQAAGLLARRSRTRRRARSLYGET